MKYHLITYGCQMNTADSEEMAQPLQSRGFTATADIQTADIVLMNTCTVREQAEHRAQSNLGRLREWKAADPHRILIVAGCAASRWGDSIKKRYPYIDLVAPATQIEKFPEVIGQVLKERWNWDAETRETFSKNGDASPIDFSPTLLSADPSRTPVEASPGVSIAPTHDLFGNQQTAYVTIMRGCNYSCSYCIVPQVRGRELYRTLPDILGEIRYKVTQGFNEVMLLGQTVNSYYYRTGGEGERGSPTYSANHISHEPNLRIPESVVLDFSDLLRAVNAIEGVERIRFMSPHPRHMRDSVIAAMAESSKVCRHIHLPAQSGSSRLLSQMKRLYTREEYTEIIEKLRQAMPKILITTDIIVGYPGESDEDFNQTLSFLQQIQFDGLFAFKYSPRPDTAAAHLPDDVPNPMKEDRLQQVLTLNKQIQQAGALPHSSFPS